MLSGDWNDLSRRRLKIPDSDFARIRWSLITSSMKCCEYFRSDLILTKELRMTDIASHICINTCSSHYFPSDCQSVDQFWEWSRRIGRRHESFLCRNGCRWKLSHCMTANFSLIWNYFYNGLGRQLLNREKGTSNLELCHSFDSRN